MTHYNSNYLLSNTTRPTTVLLAVLCMLVLFACGESPTPVDQVGPEEEPLPTAEFDQEEEPWPPSAEEKMRRWRECAISALEDTTYEQASEVMAKYRAWLRSQYRFTLLGVSKLRLKELGKSDPEMKELGDALGIIVGFAKDPEQENIPKEERLPDCLDGIPIRVVEFSRQKYASEGQ